MIGYGDRKVLAVLSLTSMKTSFQKLVWLGALAISTTAFTVASENSQIIIDGPEKQAPYRWLAPTFDTVEDVVDQWTENDREFMNRNGQKCAYSRRELWRLESF